jgi:predicted enzyme related to lactoylglutathione lyase
MRIAGLREVILYVKDLPGQARFYGEVLGLDRIGPETEAELDEAEVAWFRAGDVAIALHSGGEGEPGADGPALVFTVDDVEAAHAHLSSAGVQVEPVVTPESGSAYAVCFDPEGFMLQLEEG